MRKTDWRTIVDKPSLETPEASWYWDRFAGEMFRRGYLQPSSTFTLENLVDVVLMRDAIEGAKDRPRTPKEQSNYLDFKREIQEKLSDALDLCMLPPNFADATPKKSQ